jgi:hypothetical protein
MTWPIYIPSKGRPNSRLIAELADFASIVVEPQDLDAYLTANPAAKFLVLPSSNQGIGYVRNYILATARERQHAWFWMIDDDVQGFYKNPGNFKVTATQALETAEALISKVLNVGQAALEYQQFAWSAKRQWALNSYCDVVVAINVARTRSLKYRPEANLKEDRDFTLQVLASGRNTMRVQCVGFRAPANGSNAGGLSDAYHREPEAVERMTKLWPGVVTKQVKANGRVDCKIDWKVFKK